MRLILTFLLLVYCAPAFAQEYGKPDRDNPGDAMIQEYLSREALRLETNFLGEVKTLEDWQRDRGRYQEEYLEMLGLAPFPEKSPLQLKITHTLDRGEYQVDCLYFQSRPGIYVTANLYRPTHIPEGERLPAVLYVCGHSGRGRNGNKTAFQSHGIWFARHGYICLILDTLQLGEIAGIHHGTYREGRWWWLSRGYTPAGVECWNGIRAIDYLTSRPDVDPERIGVTGISGGGAATYWITAADPRVKVAVPVSGMADLASYVPNRVINGHCDCMFLYNAYQWPWTRIAALIAPRPLLFVNSDHDAIFPMDANERVINRLERIYSLYGAGDRVDAFVSIGGHDYRQDIRQAAFRFLNTYLKNDPRPVEDTEVDLVSGGPEPVHPIPPEELRAFRTDAEIPGDAINSRAGQEFIRRAQAGSPAAGQFDAWRADLLGKLRRLTFHHFPERIPAGKVAEEGGPALDKSIRLNTEANIVVPLQNLTPPQEKAASRLIILVKDDSALSPPPGVVGRPGDLVFALEPRGFGPTRWTTNNPPNYVERSHYLLGRTVDSGRVWDIVAAARYVKAKFSSVPVTVIGQGAGGVLALYAGLLEPDIAKVVAMKIPKSLNDPGAPLLLNALRVCDISDVVRMLTSERAEVIP